MKIAIIGAGNLGRALGGAWRTDHHITYGVRSPDDAKYADLDAPTVRLHQIAHDGQAKAKA